MDKRFIIPGILLLGVAAYLLWPKVSAAAANYVRQLSDVDLQGIIAAAMNGTSYANLSAADVQQLYSAAQAEMARRTGVPYGAEAPAIEARGEMARQIVASSAAVQSAAAAGRQAASAAGKAFPARRFNIPGAALRLPPR